MRTDPILSLNLFVPSVVLRLSLYRAVGGNGGEGSRASVPRRDTLKRYAQFYRHEGGFFFFF